MLFDLKQKKKPHNFLNCFIGGNPAAVPFNPLTYDAHTIALWDGDNLAAGAWLDSVSGQSLTLFNSPTINMAGLNGHGTITFDGVNDYAKCLTPNALPFTIYLVYNPIAYIGNEILLDDAVTTSTKNTLIYSGGTPRVVFNNATATTGTTNGKGLNVYRVLSIGVQSGLNASWWIEDLNLKTMWGNATARAAFNGFTLGANTAGIVPANCGFAYIIIRDVSDDQATADLFITYLKDRFLI